MKKKTEQKQNPTLRKNPSTARKVEQSESWKLYAPLSAIVLISFIIYLPVLQNGLLGWDDEPYIKNNPLIYSINLKEIFSQYVMGNYHPLTILTLATGYHFFGLNETGYHAVNLVLHLLNVVLVFYAIFLISDKRIVALVTALLFGIHPLHVESVAWAAELKDLLYTFFFLASYIFYLKYRKEQQKKFYAIALVLFLLSLLSKAMAASLPVLLILTDYYLGSGPKFGQGKINGKTLLEKVPFFLLAIVFGVVAIMAQKSSNAIQDIESFSFLQRIAFACYGFITYLIKLLLPIQLSAFYPYPIKHGNDIPAWYFGYVLLFIAVMAAVFYSLRFSTKVFFGFGFFAVTVFLVLQLLPVGNAIMADRYSYIPSIGIFFLAGEGLFVLWNRKPVALTWMILGVSTVLLSAATYARAQVWNNGITLWTDAIGKFPEESVVYNNRGLAYKDVKKQNEALEDFGNAIQFDPGFAEAYINRGNILRENRRLEEALRDYNKAIELKPEYAEAYDNRGGIFMDGNNFEKALQDYNKAIELKPDHAKAYNNRGIAYMNAKNYSRSVEDFNKAIALSPGFADAYLNRGNVKRADKKFEEALTDYDKAILIKPDYAEAYNNRGGVYMDEKKYAQALESYNKAINLKPDFANAYNNRGIVHYNEKRYQEAISDYSKAIELSPQYGEAFFDRGVAYYFSGNKDAACMDLERASGLGYPQAPRLLQQICK